MHGVAVAYHWDQRFLYANEVLEAEGASTQGGSDQGDEKSSIGQSLLMWLEVGLQDDGVEMFGFGGEHLDGICVGLDNDEIIAEGTMDMCYFFALEYMKDTAIIIVHYLDDPIWDPLLGNCLPTNIVWNLFDQVPETLQEVVSPSDGVEGRV